MASERFYPNVGDLICTKRKKEAISLITSFYVQNTTVYICAFNENFGMYHIPLSQFLDTMMVLSASKTTRDNLKKLKQ